MAFGGVLARFPVLGLEMAAQDRLLRQYFPGVELVVTAENSERNEHCHALPADEFDDLRALLMAHRSEGSEEMRWLACTIATACLGNNHLFLQRSSNNVTVPERACQAGNGLGVYVR